MSESRQINLRGQHDLGEIIGNAYRLYLANFTPLFLIALTTVPLSLLGVIVERQFSVPQGFALLVQLAGTFVSIIAAAALVHAVHDVTGGTPPEPSRALDAVFERIPSLFATVILFVALLMLAAVAAPFLAIYWLVRRDATIGGRRDWWLALLPLALFFYLAVRWGFTVQAYAIDGGRAWSAFDASAAAVRDQWWRTLGIIIVMGLLQLGPTLLATTSMLAAPIVEGVITSMIGALLLPFGIIGSTLLYYDLKARNANAPPNPPAGIDAAEPDVPGQSPRDI